MSEFAHMAFAIIVGEAFVTNELFHNWGSVEERQEDVMKYMAFYVDYIYQAGELYNTATADNGVTRYSLVYRNTKNWKG